MNDEEYKRDPSLQDVQIRLWQYENLRKHFDDLVKEVLGEGYYNEAIDVYTCDEFTCRDLKSKLKKKWWRLI